jgi:hypothetical protein
VFFKTEPPGLLSACSICRKEVFGLFVKER